MEVTEEWTGYISVYNHEEDRHSVASCFFRVREMTMNGHLHKSADSMKATVLCRRATYPPKTTYLPVYLPKTYLL